MILVDKYNTVMVDEYKGAYSIVAGYVDNEGNERAQLCKRSFKGEEKKSPIAVRIGTRDTARETLIAIYREIYGDNDVPF